MGLRLELYRSICKPRAARCLCKAWAFSEHLHPGLEAITSNADCALQARTLRLADGPDEVHLASIAAQELKRVQSLPRPKPKL